MSMTQENKPFILYETMVKLQDSIKFLDTITQECYIVANREVNIELSAYLIELQELNKRRNYLKLKLLGYANN